MRSLEQPRSLGSHCIFLSHVSIFLRVWSKNNMDFSHHRQFQETFTLTKIRVIPLSQTGFAFLFRDRNQPLALELQFLVIIMTSHTASSPLQTEIGGTLVNRASLSQAKKKQSPIKCCEGKQKQCQKGLGFDHFITFSQGRNCESSVILNCIILSIL